MQLNASKQLCRIFPWISGSFKIELPA